MRSGLSSNNTATRFSLMHILITAGNTQMPMDRVRCITNIFSGRTGASIALQAYQRAIQADPSRIDYYEDLISLLLDFHKTNAASVLVNHALAIAPNALTLLSAPDAVAILDYQSRHK